VGAVSRAHAAALDRWHGLTGDTEARTVARMGSLEGTTRPSTALRHAMPDGTVAVGRRLKPALWLLGLSLVGWSLLAWMALDMAHPVAQLTMPASSSWTWANASAILAMWAVMMAAMMLPSALPTAVTFARVCERAGERPRLWSFISAYLLVWLLFSIAATAAQWVFQNAGWVNPMIVSTSAWLSASLLLIAGVYQFTSLKRICLGHCRTPIGFLLGEWRAGMLGAFRMGLRHGMFCLACCWAMMALLFVGGVMNLPWIAALAVAVAIEKLAPHGHAVALTIGVGLIAAGAIRLLISMQAMAS
jgi:predicted metal-binding membrane protein